jgi:hypothetical protein
VYNKEGNYSAKRRLRRKSKIDYVEVELSVKNNPNTKLETIGRKFGISSWHSAMVLKRLDIAIKKTFTYVEANEEKQNQYLNSIKKGTW